MLRTIGFLLFIIGLTACTPEPVLVNQISNGTDVENNPVSITETPFQPVIISITPTKTPDPVYLTGAGDISVCDYETDDATAALLENVPGLVFTLGDTQYSGSTYEKFSTCFDQSWGKYKERMIPVIGNHEYEDNNAAGYYDYFENELDPDRQGYYSMDVGAWHVIVLNSQCDAVGGCDKKSPQVQWLESDLAKDSHLCTLALWHHPRFSTGYHGPDKDMDAIWQLMVENDVELVINGHEHNYERFAPMDADGKINLSDGTRMIIAGTGGADLRPQYLQDPASLVYSNNSYGVLQLKLEYGTYTWEFIPVEGSTFSDSGWGYCY